jgi:dolichol-phosphate mannosyltransferase
MMMTDEKDFSIIVPTFREAKNIPALIRRIAQIDFGPRSFEVIIVDDDSRDGLEEVVIQLRNYFPWIKLLRRYSRRSLSASAVEGFQRARYSTLILMDADLSHPPEKLPEMLAALHEAETDFVIGSRYIRGGSVDEVWPVPRRISSRLSASMARLLISASVRDPLSGFFAVKKETLRNGDPLKPIGWKLGLEIMLKCRCKRIREIPIHFSQRLYGKSKLNLRVAVDYWRHVSRLLFYKLWGDKEFSFFNRIIRR